MPSSPILKLARRQPLRAGAAAVFTRLCSPIGLRRRRVFHLARGQFDPSASRALLLGTGHPATAVWAYSGTVSGKVLRLPQGEPFRAVVENRLSEPTTEHWHGVRLRNAMEGVPNLTQAAMPPGA